MLIRSLNCVLWRSLCGMSEDRTAAARERLRNGHPTGWIPDTSTFGARLALVRQHMGWGNVKQAAQLCSIAPETWRTWERDNIEPKSLVSACMKIAGVTGVDYRWLALGPAHSTTVVDDGGNVAVWTQENPRAREVARVTPEYRAVGERIIAVVGAGGPVSGTSGTSSPVRTDVRKGVRTRPLER
jgi:hypothetical protein